MSKQEDDDLATQQAHVPPGFIASEGCIDDYDVLKPIGSAPRSPLLSPVRGPFPR